MPKRLNFMTGVVLLVVAGTLAFVVTSGRDDEQGKARAAKRGKGSGARTWPGEAEPGENGEDRSEMADSVRSAKSGYGTRRELGTTAQSGRVPTAVRTDLKVQVSPEHPRHAELAERAEKVEAFAQRRLEDLTTELDLSPEQQVRIFPILVRGSQSYDPGMRIVEGSNATATPSSEKTADAEPLDKESQNALLQKELKPEQADKLVDRSIGDLLIWEEIIGDLTRQLDQTSPGQVVPEVPPERGMTGASPEAPAGTPSATEADSTTPPESHGGRNIFDTVPEE